MDRRKGTRDPLSGAIIGARRAAEWLARFEFPVLSAVYLYYVVADGVPLLAFGLIALVWTARAWTTGSWLHFTPLDLPIAVILVWLPISLWVSTNWWLSLPKVYGVVLGVVFFYAVVANIRTSQDAQGAVFWLSIVFAAIALAGLVGTDWAQGKILSLSLVYDRLPRIVQGIPRSIAGGFARNGVGGTLTLTIPFLAALLLRHPPTADPRPTLPAQNDSSGASPERSRRVVRLPSFVDRRPRSGPAPLGPAASAGSSVVIPVALALSLITLALTQSRGAILGTTVGLAAVAIWRERRLAWILLAPAIGLVVLVIMGQGNRLLEFLLRMDAQSGTLASRLEVWQRGIWMVQDFPFTGVGIGTYNEIAHSLYPFFIAAPTEVVAHAHNTLLQVAVDLGIPGLIAFVALLTGCLLCAVRAYRATTDPEIRALLAGLLFAMLAHQVFGLTDAFMMGTKPGVLIWIFFGLAVAVYQSRITMTNKDRRVLAALGRAPLSVVSQPSAVE